ncbi:centromere protein U isoform X2 [Bos indicus]|uniref:Centromere protein U n=1 Tax=Bos indicus TaxID=9915 RepID=A0ABM4RQJ0_BOSIN
MDVLWRRQAAASAGRYSVLPRAPWAWCGGIRLLCPQAGVQSSRGHHGRGVEASGCCVHRPVLRPPEGTMGVVWGHQAAVSMGRCSVLPRGPGACCGDVSCCVHGPVLGPPEGTLDVLWSSDTSEIEASENESVKISAKKPRRKLKPISDESESPEESDVRRKVKPTENISTQHEAVSATALPGLSEKPAEAVTPQKTGPQSAESSAEKATLATEHQLKTQKNKMYPGKRKKPRGYTTDTSDCAPIWCLKEKKASDIMELDVFLSAFENILLEYEQKIDSRVCKAAINKFHSNLKEELIKMVQEIQMLKTLKRKNAKMISNIEKKRQRLIEVQDELLRVEPELKQLQIKYEELQERKASLRKAAYFLSNLKQLHQDYSDVQEEEPSVKETYDSSSLPALLFKARPLLGAEHHLQNINYQLENLLDQK